jgi:L-ascorbate metabolism protein UlaG (beta-lactamase superfamily)
MDSPRRLAASLSAFVAAALPFAQAGAAENERCPRLVAELRPEALLASFRFAAKGEDEVRLTFIGHATFLIESPVGVRIVTDYNDYVRPSVLPDIITMNRAHSTHYTNNPDPAIKHVLRGWAQNGEPVRYDFKYKDVWVRSVPTNIRDWGGGTILYGNSIFVFEVAGLCIAHLGHLHHTLTPAHIDELGRIDVVLVPIDGTYTFGIDGMVEVLQQIKPRLIIPMHIFGPSTLERFIERIRQIYPVEFGQTPSILLARSSLPAAPKMLMLPGR